LAPHALIQQLQHHEISFIVLAFITMLKIGATENLQIGYHQPQHTTRFEDAKALLQ